MTESEKDEMIRLSSTYEKLFFLHHLRNVTYHVM